MLLTNKCIRLRAVIPVALVAIPVARKVIRRRVVILVARRAIRRRVVIPVARRVIPNRVHLKVWLVPLPQAGPAAVAKVATRASSVVPVASPRRSPRVGGPAPAVMLVIPARSALNAASPNKQLRLQAGPAAVAL